MVEYLLSKGSKSKATHLGRTPLMASAAGGHVQAALCLLQSGAADVEVIAHAHGTGVTVGRGWVIGEGSHAHGMGHRGHMHVAQGSHCGRGAGGITPPHLTRGTICRA